MAVLEIGGQRVEVDDRFLSLSPEEQAQTVEQIAATMGIQAAPEGQGETGAPEINAIPQERGLFGSIAQAFTGADRATPRTESTPELEFSDLLADEGVAANAKIAALSLITPDPNEMAQILQANFPHVQVEQDEKGNLFAINTQTGAEAVLNRPGFSYSDFTGLIGQGLLFTPAGRGLGAVTRLGRIGQVAGRSALTQTAVEEAQQMAGGTFDAEDIALEGVLGAGGQAAGEAVGALARRRANRLAREAETAVSEAELLEAQRIGGPLSPEMQGQQQQRVLERIAGAVEEQAKGTDINLPKLRELAQEADIDPEALAAAQRLDVANQLIPSQLARNQEYIEIEQGLASIIGSQLNAQQKVGIDLVAQKADDLITTFGGSIDKAGLSDRLKDTILLNVKRLQDESDAVYAQVNNIIPGETPVNMSETIFALQLEARKQGGIARLEPLEQKLLKLAQENPTYANLDKERKKVGLAYDKLQGDRIYTNVETGQLKRIYQLLIGDQKAAAQQNGAGDLYELGSKLVEQRKTLEKQSLVVLGRDQTRSIMPTISETLRRTTTGDIAGFKKAMLPLDPEQRQIAVLSALNDVFTGSSRKEKQFSAPQFVDWYRGLKRNKTAFDEVMKHVPEGAQERLADLFTLANRIRLAGAERVTTGRLRTMLDDFQAPGGLVDKVYATGKDVGPTALAAEVAGQIATGVPGAGGTIAGVVKAMSKPAKDKLSVSATNLLGDVDFQNLTKQMARASVETDAALQEAADKVAKSKAYQDWLDSLPTDYFRQALRLGVVGYFTAPNPEPTPYEPGTGNGIGQPLELTITPRDIPQTQR